MPIPDAKRTSVQYYAGVFSALREEHLRVVVGPYTMKRFRAQEIFDLFPSYTLPNPV
jgi:hypothetical protein